MLNFLTSELLLVAMGELSIRRRKGGSKIPQSKRGRISYIVVARSRQGGNRLYGAAAEQVDRIHGRVHLPLFSIFSMSVPCSVLQLGFGPRGGPRAVREWKGMHKGGCRTGDVLIEDVIFLDDIVEYLFGVLVDD